MTVNVGEVVAAAEALAGDTELSLVYAFFASGPLNQWGRSVFVTVLGQRNAARSCWTITEGLFEMVLAIIVQPPLTMKSGRPLLQVLGASVDLIHA